MAAALMILGEMPEPADVLRDFTPSGFFVLRTPLLPFGDAEDAGEARGSLDERRRTSRARLREALGSPEAREAIFVASPELHAHVEAWLDDPNTPDATGYERALVRYASRMRGRATPFGLFAGVSTGRIGPRTHLGLEVRAAYRRHTRIDAEFLLQVVDALLAQPARRARTAYRPNPSLYRVGDRRRYVRSRPGADEHRHVLVSVRDSPQLQAALDAAGPGARPAAVAAAVVATGIEAAAARRLVDDLIDQQVLLPTLQVQLTGADSVYGLSRAARPLARVKAELRELDLQPIGVAADRYRAVAASLAPLPLPVSIDRLFQVDMTKPSPRAALGPDVVREVLRGAELLQRLGPPPADKPIERFIERFRSRFEERAVPLLEALDPDIGVSVDGNEHGAAPLLRNLMERDRPRPSTWTAREEHLLSRLMGVVASGAPELVLEAPDVERLQRSQPPPLPDAFAVIAVLGAASDADIDAGRFRVLVSRPDGPSGARLLGRFCHEDALLRDAVKAHLRAEEALDRDAIYAEIVHLPRARDVNVLARPVLRAYEIECLGRSGAPADRRLPLGDLLISVEDDELVLRSKRLRRRIVPRLTSAHNYLGRGVAVYRLLCQIQAGDVDDAGFWGALGSAPALPRVRHGRVILQRARWRLGLQDLVAAPSRDDDHDAVQAWRLRQRVPRHVLLIEQSYELPVDLDDVLAVDSLVQAVRAGRGARIEELFPDPGELCARGPEGAFAHELVVPFVRVRPNRRATRGAGAVSGPRVFTPGSEWVYARIYTGETLADRVLSDEVGPLVRQLAVSGLVDRWFFLRYADPDFHLRLRLHGSAEAAVEALGGRLQERGMAWRIDLGTYEREVERYGGPEAIDVIERVFHHDSVAVLELLARLEPGDEGQQERWRIALAGAHRLLVDLGLDSTDRGSVVSALRASRARRLGWGHRERVKLGERFRRERGLLGQLVDQTGQGPVGYGPGLEVLAARSAALRPLALELADLDRAGRLTVGRTEIAASLLHMHLNRLLRGDNIAQEAVICDYLARLYDADVKRRPRSPVVGSRGSVEGCRQG